MERISELQGRSGALHEALDMFLGLGDNLDFKRWIVAELGAVAEALASEWDAVRNEGGSK